MPDVSIAISVKDNFSDAITTMKNANQSFNKDLTGTMEKLDKLNETKYQLKVDTDKARDALKEAEKQYEKTGDAADKMNRDMAASNYDSAKRNLNLVSQNARQAEKDILSMTGAIEKSDNRASRGGAASGEGSGFLSKLAGAGFTKMIGDSLTGAAQTYITSAVGGMAGNAVNSIMGGMAAGAAMGSVIPIPGATVAGAAIGGVAGTINAATQYFKVQDDAFKSSVQDQYNSIQQEESDMKSSGSALAAQRETDKIAFSTILGSQKKSNSFLDSIREFGNATPFEYDDLTRISKTLLAYGYKQNEIIPLLTKVGDTGSALGMSTSDINTIATMLGRMQSTGKATLEYLNPLLERGIPVWDYLAKASGKTKEQVQDMVSKGLVPGQQASKAIADYMGKANQGSMAMQSKTFSGLQSTLEDAQNELKSAMGEGYNEELKKGLQSQISTLSGATGSALQEAYKMQGKFQAQLENSQQELMDNALTSVVSGTVTGEYDDNAETDKKVRQRLQALADDYKKQKTLADKGSMEAEKKQAQDVEEAKVIAANAYKASKGYQLELESDLSLAQSIRDDTSLSSTYYQTGIKMGEEFSKGLAAAAAETAPNALKNAIPSRYLTGNSSTTPGINTTGNPYAASSQGKSNATGILRVPYNNYPALLHEDERVLTGVEARSQKGFSGVLITGNAFNVRKESDIDDIASLLYRKLQKADAVTP